MEKVCDVMVGSFKVNDIESYFREDAYGSTIRFIKHNVAFEDLESGVKKMLISSFALFAFSYEKFRADIDCLIFDGVSVPHKYIYDFIIISSDKQLKELLTVNKFRGCPEAFVRNMNSFFYSKMEVL